MKYCKYCGKELNNNEQCTCAEAVEESQKKKKFSKLAIIGGGVMIAIILVIAIALSAKINPFNADVISFTGMDGYGDVIVDEEKLIEIVIGEEPSELDDKYFEWYEKYDELSQGITYEIESMRYLANNDEVVVTFTFTGLAAKEFKDGSKTLTVSGLKEVEKVDVFDYIDYTFEGMNGYGTIKITKKTGVDSFIDAIHFSVSDNVENGKLLNGSDLEIVVECSESVVENFGKAPEEKSMFVTVEGLGEYATLETVPVGTLQVHAKQFASEREALNKEETSSMFSYSDVEVYGIYFAKTKDPALTYNDNEVHILISYVQYLYGEYHSTIYLPLVFENVALDEDGTVPIDYEDGSGSGSFYTDADEYLSNISEDFTVTKIS